MSLKRVFFATLTLMLVFTFCEESFAQRHQRGPLRRGGEFLGLGWGAGNHWQANPVNSSYYNPYTPHNSHLISRPTGTMNSGYGQQHQFNQGAIQIINGATYPDQTPLQELPGTIIHAETHPADLEAKESSDDNDAESASGKEEPSLTFGNGDFESKGAELFERPVLADPSFKPTVDNKVKEKIEQLNDGNFWSEK